MVTEDQNQRRTAGQKLSDFCQHLLSCCGVLPCRESEELETVYCQQSTSAQAPSLSPPSEIPLHRPRKASFSLPIGESFYPQSTRRTGGNGEVKVLPELNEQISNLQQLHDFLKKLGSESCLQSHILFEFCKRVARTSRNTGDGFTLFVHPIKVEEISSLGSMNVNPTLITKYVEDSQVVDPIQCASYLKLTSSSTNAEFVAAESELSNLLLTKLECRPTFEAISLNPVFIKEGPPPERLFASVLELKYDHQEYLRFCNAKAKSMGIKVLDIRIFSEEVPSQPPLQRLQNKTKMCTRIVETIQASLPLLQKLDDEEESHYVIFDVHLNVCPYWLTQITVSSVCSDGVSPESCPAIRDSRAEIKRLEHFGDNLIEWQSPTKVLKAEVCNKIIASKVSPPEPLGKLIDTLSALIVLVHQFFPISNTWKI
ncbi:hypothetical protein L5515_018365 [Caenorhabditis briggsae]|uniref:Uncharacterized protein n=1 Tax=Caenorhabditis briggsae TaxID=6238 RepID=A0AAE9FGB8_CAEBR|nr:hypothetical protein L5515_018365 [Caenorhabditis briggsae]